MYRAFAIIAAMLLCLLLMYLALGKFPARVRLGRNSRCRIQLEVKGREPRLEQSVMELLELLRRGGLCSELVIQGSLLDAETRRMAMALAEDYGCVTFIEDGESPWTRKTNCWKYPAR